MWIRHSTSSTAWSAWTRLATTDDIPTLSTLGAAPANVTLTATSNTDTTTTTPAVASGTVASVMQTIWAKIRSVVNSLAGKENTIAAGTTAQYWRGDKTWQTFPTIPAAASNGTLTIQRHGVSAGTFTANQSTNTTINITAPTWAEVTGKPTTFDPTSHASTATTYGQGTQTNYGHLKQTATARTAAATSDTLSLGSSFGQYALSVTHMGTQASIDLNNFTAYGDFLFYTVTTRTNFPTLPSGANTSNPSFCLEVRQFGYDANNVRQKLAMRGAASNTTFNAEFTRQRNNGTWTSWVQTATTADIPTLSTLGAAPANISLTAETGTGTDTATGAISSGTVQSVMQTVWNKIRQLTNVINSKQNTITSTGTTNLLTAPVSSGSNPGTKAMSDFLASPAAQTANRRLLLAPATKGNAPDMLAAPTVVGTVPTFDGSSIIWQRPGGSTTLTAPLIINGYPVWIFLDDANVARYGEWMAYEAGTYLIIAVGGGGIDCRNAHVSAGRGSAGF